MRPVERHETFPGKCKFTLCKKYRHNSQGGLDNSQSHSANVLLLDNPSSEPHALHELTLNKMAEDAESDIAIRLVDENDYREISAKALSAKRKIKKNRPPSLV